MSAPANALAVAGVLAYESPTRLLAAKVATREELKKSPFYEILAAAKASPFRHLATLSPARRASTKKLRRCTLGIAKNNHVSGTKRTIRPILLRLAIHDATSPLTVGLAGLALWHGCAFADQSAWDCRVGRDGASWQCEQLGPDLAEPVSVKPDAVGQSSQPQIDRQPVEPDRPATRGTQKTAPLPEPDEPAVPPPAGESMPDGESDSVSRPTKDSVAGATLEQATGPADTSQAPAAEMSASATPLRPAAAKAAKAADQSAMHAFEDSSAPDLLTPTDAALPADSQTTAVAQTNAAAETTTHSLRPIASRIDEGIDWDTCQSVAGTAGVALSQDTLSSLPVEVSADGAVAELDAQKTFFDGAVHLVQGDLQMYADELVVNRVSGEVDAKGDILMRHPDIRVAGDAASYQLATGHGQIEQASYLIPSTRARGDAERAELLGDGLSEYRKITYTTCRPGDSDWLLSADELKLDQAEGLGKARHASMRFLGVPILYAPIFTFPIDDRRRSGLLIPSIGQSNNTGVDISIPYYFNLAENYDLTLTPRLMSKRGVMLGGEFRFLTESTRGTLAAEILPNDREYENGNSTRGGASLNSRTQLTPRASANLRLNYVSDSDYLNDFGRSLAATSATHLERAGEVRYFGDTWDLLGRVQHYQTIDDAIPAAGRPYSRLPQLLLGLENPDGIAGTTYHLQTEYVNFHRRDALHGHRIDLFPAISMPLRNDWGFVEPKVGARYTAYQLGDQPAGVSDSPSRFMGMFSLDSGLYFDRSANYFGTGTTQTLEPRMYYLYVPYRDQDDQPLFDTAEFDFSFDNLFRENRFNGPDRFGDANQVTLALTNRTISDESGRELLRASIGQIFYFEDREVTLPGQPIEDDSTSAIAGELAAQLGGGWHTRAGLEWNPHEGDKGTIDQSLAELGYRDGEGHLFNVAYRLRKGVTEQTDVAAFWPIGDQVTLIGRHNYSLRDGRVIEALAGIEYGRCCWRLRGLVRQLVNGTGDDHNLSFLIQLELNGLGRLGNDIDQILERGIYGYRRD